MPDFRDRLRERRERHALEADNPGAPPGFLLDLDDDRSHELVGEVPRDRWDPAGPANFLARGDGESED